MKVTVTSPESFGTTLSSAEEGKFYKDKDGDIYFITSYAATCLTDTGKTYTSRGSCKLQVTRIPAGSTITIITD